MRFSSFIFVAVVAWSVCVSQSACAAARERTGFYLRLSWGMGLPRFSGSAQDAELNPPIQSGYSAQGVSLTASVLAGGALRPGLIFGAGALTAISFNLAPKQTRNGQPYFEDDDGGPNLDTYALAGPFIDYYPEPTLGLHVQVLAGPATHGSADLGAGGSSGFGLMGGIGYDAWVSDLWSVGLLARLTYTNTTATVSFFERDIMVAPSLEACAVFF